MLGLQFVKPTDENNIRQWNEKLKEINDKLVPTPETDPISWTQQATPFFTPLSAYIF